MKLIIPSAELVSPCLKGHVWAIARLISRAEAAHEECQEALGEIHRHTGKAHIVGITGVPGCGKSTLVAQLCKAIRAINKKVGVVAVDPSSPFTGGAILGDRIRMNELISDAGVFIRSMATHGALGGLAKGTLSVVDILDAAGYDMVIIETVGVGQDEIDIVQAAHTTVVVSAPGLGDDIQAIKAGILEIADIHVVSKCDRSDANSTITELKSMLTMSLQLSNNGAGNNWQTPVLSTSAKNNEGIQELLQAIENHLVTLRSSGQFDIKCRQIAKTRLLKAAEDLLRDKFGSLEKGLVFDLTAKVVSRQTHPNVAAETLLNQFFSEVEL